AGDAERLRGGPIAWRAVSLTESDAVRAARSSGALGSGPLISVTLAQLGGRPGYAIQPGQGREVWVDAATGVVRGELDSAGAVAAAQLLMRKTDRTADRTADRKADGTADVTADVTAHVPVVARTDRADDDRYARPV